MSVTVEEVPEKPVEDADAAAEEEDVIEVDRDTTSLDLTRTRLKKIEGFEFLKKIKSLPKVEPVEENRRPGYSYYTD